MKSGRSWLCNPISEETEDNETPAAPPEAEGDGEGDGGEVDDVGGEDDPGGGGGDDDFELPDAHEIGDAELAAEIPSATSVPPAPLPAEVIVYSGFLHIAFS